LFRQAGLPEPIGIGVCTGDPAERLLDGDPLPATGWEHPWESAWLTVTAFAPGSPQRHDEPLGGCTLGPADLVDDPDVGQLDLTEYSVVNPCRGVPG